MGRTQAFLLIYENMNKIFYLGILTCDAFNWATRMNMDGSGPLSLLDDQANISINPTAKIENSKHSVQQDSQPDPENIISYFPESDFDALNEYINLISLSPKSKAEENERRWKLFKLF